MTSSSSPNTPPTPAPTAASFLDDDEVDVMRMEGELDANADAVAVVVTVIWAAVAEAVRVTGSGFVLLGDVEPDVRLKITSPASIKNGDVVPLVAFKQVLLEGSTWPQQNAGRN